MYAEDADPRPIEDTPTANIEQALNEANSLHKLLDDLEARLFGQSPKQGTAERNSANVVEIRPPLFRNAVELRQRLDTATSRLGALINRI